MESMDGDGDGGYDMKLVVEVWRSGYSGVIWCRCDICDGGTETMVTVSVDIGWRWGWWFRYGGVSGDTGKWI